MTQYRVSHAETSGDTRKVSGTRLGTKGAPMARKVKRDFATIRQLPSKKWQVRYTGPDGIRYTAPKTFSHKVDADAYMTAKRRRSTAKPGTRTATTSPNRSPSPTTPNDGWSRQVAGRPIKARTREHYQAILDDHLTETFGPRLLVSIKPKNVREWYARH